VKRRARLCQLRDPHGTRRGALDTRSESSARARPVARAVGSPSGREPRREQDDALATAQDGMGVRRVLDPKTATPRGARKRDRPQRASPARGEWTNVTRPRPSESRRAAASAVTAARIGPAPRRPDSRGRRPARARRRCHALPSGSGPPSEARRGETAAGEVSEKLQQQAPRRRSRRTAIAALRSASSGHGPSGVQQPCREQGEEQLNDRGKPDCQRNRRGSPSPRLSTAKPRQEGRDARRGRKGRPPATNATAAT